MRSDTHNEIQEIVKEHFRAMGWIAIKEHCVNGKKIDVLAQHKGTKYTIANEVQLAAKHYKENILLDLKAGCDEVRIISLSKKISDRIERRAYEELDGKTFKKVKFQVKDEFIPYLNNNKTTKNKAEFNAELKPEQKTE